MLELLKGLAMSKLSELMGPNKLDDNATKEASEEGTNALLESLKGGGMGQLTDLFSSGGDVSQSGVANDLKGKLSQILQGKGMAAEEADAEASRVAPDVLNNLKDKFQSEAEEDKGFDLSDIGSLLSGGGGGLGNLINKATDLLGK